MRAPLGAVATFGVLAGVLMLAGGPDAIGARLAQAPRAAADVDLELILAVDVSYSMDPDEQALQREGYILGLTSPEFLGALKQGAHGRIAITYFEWAGIADQKVVVPWRLIDGAATAKAFTDQIAAAPYRRAYRTSISGALLYASPLFDANPFHGMRRTVDVSGDGVNNQGPPVTTIRDELLAKTVTLNGLPIMLKRPMAASMDIENLDVYYEDCVIGGPGAFVVPIKEREHFKDATRTKLVLEVAGRTPPARVVPVTSEAPRISCMIGERMWQYRWGGQDFN
jgi:Protein of unknown function (DUF1194)